MSKDDILDIFRLFCFLKQKRFALRYEDRKHTKKNRFATISTTYSWVVFGAPYFYYGFHCFNYHKILLLLLLFWKEKRFALQFEDCKHIQKTEMFYHFDITYFYYGFPLFQLPQNHFILQNRFALNSSILTYEK